ncbi:VIT1/CCC1 transporter family protein [Dermatobacter hominis]|uniref:VIT1/CCC1 transporter family protein n=1 Tax=Dermatobacter hominis TaxID=2884263 RepID=UPI001D12FD2C|nr:VIT1/CCC1 transporter family protein [Dermatobacter hominis]UDY34720.1 VIT1/CCC1 transporter family protein [Dermatobacter hominis]
MTGAHRAPPRTHRPEDHRSRRAGWIRAMVLGANDGLLSTGALLLGVAAAGASTDALLTAGVAALVAGALSMGLGEYVSVSSQLDVERADRVLEENEIELHPDAETRELRSIYVARGLTPELAAEVADALMAHDPVTAHMRDELGHTEEQRARPLQAALSSTASFAIGALVPLLVAVVVRGDARVPAVAVAAIAGMVVLGGVSSALGGAPMWRGALRVGLGGSLALAATFVVGSLFGTAVG